LSSAPDTSTDAADAEAGPQIEARHQALVDVLSAELGDAVLGTHLPPGLDPWVRVRTDAWSTAGEVAKQKAGCRFFDFLSAIDWLPSPFGRDETAAVDLASLPTIDPNPTGLATGVAGGDTRFQLLARVVDVRTGTGVLLKADIGDDMRMPTWVPLYAGANWHEREIHEMYGIDFEGHPDPRNIYLPTGFEGFPLRKDYPLLARFVKPWPGIVDVEPMPGDDDEDAEAETPPEDDA
jgi:NADH-quinone oxidoreductase subunit C